jgi:hypothetical protein
MTARELSKREIVGGHRPPLQQPDFMAMSHGSDLYKVETPEMHLQLTTRIEHDGVTFQLAQFLV